MKSARVKFRKSGILRREWKWTLIAPNGRKLCWSGGGFQNKQDCIDNWKLTVRYAPNALEEVE